MKDKLMGLLDEIMLEFIIEVKPQIILNRAERSGRIKEVEPMIIQRPKVALQYAMSVVKDRWPEAEQNIATDKEIAIQYALSVVKGRFKEYEKKIVRDAAAVVEYCMAIGERFPEAEPYIVKSSIGNIMAYASTVVKGRFLLAEARIAMKPKWIMDYCDKVLRKKPPDELHSAMTMYSFQDPDSKAVKKYFQTWGK